jgi:hypothetical protein
MLFPPELHDQETHYLKNGRKKYFRPFLTAIHIELPFSS